MASLKSLEKTGAVIHMIASILLTIWLVFILASLIYSSEPTLLGYGFGGAAVVIITLDFFIGRKIKSERIKLGLQSAISPSDFGRGDGQPHLYDTVPILPMRNESQASEEKSSST